MRGTPASNDGCTRRAPELAQLHAVDGYHVRVAKHNRPPDQTFGPAALRVSLDALAFVPYGLRAPDDPPTVGTTEVVDAMLKVDTLRGPVWRRHQGDKYGEHPDGRPAADR